MFNPFLQLSGFSWHVRCYYTRMLLRIRDGLVTRLIWQRYRCFKFDGLINDQDLSTVTRRASNEGYQFFTTALPSLGKAFDRALGDGLLQLPSSFKRYKGSGIPTFMVQHFRLVFNTDGVLLPCPSVDSIRAIRQICFYAYKALAPADPSKDAKVLAAFLATEVEVREQTEQLQVPFCQSILRFARALTAEIFQGYKGVKRPKHGKGVTADTPIKRKWSKKPRLAGLPWLDTFSSKYSHLFYFNGNHLMDEFDKGSYDPYQGWLRPPEGLTAKVILVPKDSRGPRLISAEPAFRQFIQQSIMTDMVYILEHHPATQGYVNFTSQEVNRALALEGSADLMWSTLDLKEASDRVSLALVKEIFRDAPVLLEDLLSSRSPFTRLPSGKTVELSKFAPMGSACCFPVLAYTTWVLCKAAFAVYTGTSQPIYVYGDDVIVPSTVAPHVTGILSAFGLKVNTDKSFINSRFLESCGMDAFDGHDVTPVRIRSIDFLDIGRGEIPFLHELALRSCAHGNELNARVGYHSAMDSFRWSKALLGRLPVVPEKSGLLGVYSSCESDWDVRYEDDAYPFYEGWCVRPIDELFPTDPWDHLRRIFSSIGRGPSPTFGKFNLPRKWRLVRSRVPVHLVPQGTQPEWVRDIAPA